MAARVTLLILVTGLFTAAWSSDQEPPPVVESEPAVRPQYEPVRETALHRSQVPATERTPEQRTEWTPTVSRQIIEERPSGFPAGTYLVVDELGRTIRVVIPALPGNNELATASDHFVTEQNGERHHWIRLADSFPSRSETLEVRIDWRGLWQQFQEQRIELAGRDRKPSAWRRLISPLVIGLTSLPDDATIPVASEPTKSRKR